MLVKKYKLIGAATGWGAQVRQCEDGPEALLKFDLVSKLRQQEIPILSTEIIYPLYQEKQRHHSLKESLRLVHDVNLRLCDAVQTSFLQGYKPVLLGGDHSMAVGTWNGVNEYLIEKKAGPFGLIWIDAHMDSHIEETTPSGAWHGMPLSGLMGHGHPFLSAMKQPRPVLQPDHICLIGVRSFEEGEALLLKKNNVKIYYMEEVRERGMKAILDEAIRSVLKKVKLFGVSLDLDVIDPAIAPGVGSPEQDGVSDQDLFSALTLLRENKDSMIAFELVEYNPHRDKQEKTAQMCFDILSAVLK
jgi:arginase